MQLYITDAKVPELAPLSRAQRKQVRQGAFSLLRGERPSTRWLVGLPGGIGTALGYMVGAGLSHLVAPNGWALVILFSAALVGGGVGSVIGLWCLTARLRPYFRRFIEEHGHEITPAA